MELDKKINCIRKDIMEEVEDLNILSLHFDDSIIIDGVHNKYIMGIKFKQGKFSLIDCDNITNILNTYNKEEDDDNYILDGVFIGDRLELYVLELDR